MNLRPLQDRVVIKRIASDERTPGGIIIPDNAKEKPLQGIVVAAGPGKLFDNGRVREPLVKTGDRVLFMKYAGNEVKIEGEDHLVVREDDIVGVLET